MSDDDLQARLASALAPPRTPPPAERVAALRARAEELRARQARRRPYRTALALAAGAAALVAAGALGATLGGTGPDAATARGTAEFQARLEGADDVAVDLEGARAPEGRVVVLRSSTLPVLPVGEFYELWFVAADDGPGAPDRVSAGTFHPAYDDGTTEVVLHAAVDPTLFGDVEITAEVADGDPAPSTTVVLRGPVSLLETP